MKYSAILNMVTNKWELGRIISHCGISLERDEIEEAARLLNDYAGKTVVDSAELEELRKDRTLLIAGLARLKYLEQIYPHSLGVCRMAAESMTRDSAATRAADPAHTLPAQPKPENSMSTKLDTIEGDKTTVLIHLFNQLQAKAHANSRAKGFWMASECIAQMDLTEVVTGQLLIAWKLSRIALMHSELSECLEGIRKDLPDDHLPDRSMEVCELADTAIRILDYAGAYNLPLMEVILEKMAYNSTREFMHGKKA